MSDEEYTVDFSGPTPKTAGSPIDAKIAEDLKLSGLTVEDMRVRPMDLSIREACNVSKNVSGGYVIPYFDALGKYAAYYRVRLFNNEPKYKQVKDSPNHVYFPPNFFKVYQAIQFKYCLILEGEKKAALACKIGIPAVAFGGVDSWRNRTVMLPKEVEQVNSGNSALSAFKLPNTGFDIEEHTQSLAVGFQGLIDSAINNNTTLMICYDTDFIEGVKPAVQKAAAKLGYELRFKGVPIKNIKQIILPPIPGLPKTAFDDYIMHADGGPANFMKLLVETYNARGGFPRHPNIREHVNKTLQHPKIDRKAMQALALSIVSEFDSRGYRMNSVEEGQMYYFSHETGQLLPVDLNTSTKEQQQESAFGKLLYRDYGISTSADARLIGWLGSQFAAEDPIGQVSPHRVIARPAIGEDCIRYQLSDSQYVKVDADGFSIYRNGDEGILFASGQVKPISEKDFVAAWNGQDGRVPQNWWRETLTRTRLKDRSRHADLISYLYYLSPWLLRWRGTQLPCELAIGEPGSGKSTLYELRLDILVGEANLRNPPSDLRDWHASVANTGALHVTDNVQLVDKSLKQRLSDEICRLITEPNPHIEMRRLYSNSELMRVKVDPVFAFTAITQPFMNADIIQRSILIEFDKALANAETEDGITYDSHWKQRQMAERGGRVAWVAHQLYVIHKFFQMVRVHWNPKYKALHRLINLEQAMGLMAMVLDPAQGTFPTWIPQHMAGTTDQAVNKADWTLEGLKAYAAEFWDIRGKNTFTTTDVANWAKDEDDFKDCSQICNARALGRYISTNKYMVERIAHIKEKGTYGNKIHYIVVGPQEKS